jgi:hypothetical protein
MADDSQPPRAGSGLVKDKYHLTLDGELSKTPSGSSRFVKDGEREGLNRMGDSRPRKLCPDLSRK